MRNRIRLGLVVAAFASVVTFAQSPGRLAFEIASVKPTTQRSGIQLDGSTFSATNSALGFIVMAYGLSSCATKVATGSDCPLISGTLPAWTKSVFPARTDLYEITAKLPESLKISSSYTTAQVFEGRVEPLNLMLQSLLEDRFHLMAHRNRV